MFCFPRGSSDGVSGGRSPSDERSQISFQNVPPGLSPSRGTECCGSELQVQDRKLGRLHKQKGISAEVSPDARRVGRESQDRLQQQYESRSGE